MHTVTFKTDEAIFQFDRKSVMERLVHRKLSYEIKELDALIKAISSQPENATLSIEEHQYFGFVALRLIDAGEGSVVCNSCGKQYHFNQLKAFKVGPDDGSIKVHTGKKGFKNLFRKKPKPIGFSGGDGIKCPEDHILIYMQTWIT